MRGLINGLLIMALVYCAGCLAYKQAYVAIHDSIDEVLYKADNGTKTEKPILPNDWKIDAPLPRVDGAFGDVTKPTPPASLCNCDLSQPLVDPPWTGAQLKDAGNSMECPVFAGRDIRWAVYYPSHKETHLVGKPFAKAVQYDGARFKVPCFEFGGYRYHILGYSHNHRGKVADNKVSADGWMPYKTTTFVYSECRRAKQ